MLRTAVPAALLAGGLALGFAPVATAAEPPTLVELCAATSVEQVDALLADVAASDLVGALAPLATLTVPKGADDLVLDADVTIGEVREQLGCVLDPDPTTDPDPTPTTAPKPTPVVPAPSDNDNDDDRDNRDDGVNPTEDDGSTIDLGDNDQVSIVPEGSVDTGGA